MIYVEPGSLDAYEILEKGSKKRLNVPKFPSSGIINGYVLP
jgi:hypothetical protein